MASLAGSLSSGAAQAAAHTARQTPETLLGDLLFLDLDARSGVNLIPASTKVQAWVPRAPLSQQSLVQATDARRPLYEAAGLHGGPSIVSDGSNDLLVNTSAFTRPPAAGSRPYAWLVARFANGTQMLSLQDAAATADFLTLGNDGTHFTLARGDSDDSGTITGPITSTTIKLFELGMTVGGLRSLLVENPAVTAFDAASVGGVAVGITKLVLGAKLDASAASAVHIARLIITRDAPSLYQISEMREWLLGANHDGYTGLSYGVTT